MQTEIKPEGRINHCCLTTEPLAAHEYWTQKELVQLAIRFWQTLLDRTAVSLVNLITNQCQQPSPVAATNERTSRIQERTSILAHVRLTLNGCPVTVCTNIS